VRFSLGVPSCVDPVHRTSSEYLLELDADRRTIGSAFCVIKNYQFDLSCDSQRRKKFDGFPARRPLRSRTFQFEECLC